MGLCKGHKADNTRCTYNAKPGCKYCGIHSKSKSYATATANPLMHKIQEIKTYYEINEDTLHPQIRAKIYLDMLTWDKKYAIERIYPRINIPTLIRLGNVKTSDIKKSVEHMSTRDKNKILEALGADERWVQEVLRD